MLAPDLLWSNMDRPAGRGSEPTSAPPPALPPQRMLGGLPTGSLRFLPSTEAAAYRLTSAQRARSTLNGRVVLRTGKESRARVSRRQALARSPKPWGLRTVGAGVEVLKHRESRGQDLHYLGSRATTGCEANSTRGNASKLGGSISRSLVLALFFFN